jgi:hypothetical protein
MKSPRTPLLIVLAVLEFFLSFGALYGGATLVAVPDGSLLGVSSDLLAGSPFETFLIPGALLFVFVGVGPFVLAVAALLERAWTRTLHVVLGSGLILFELVEWWAIDYHVLQAIYIVYGAVLVVLGVIYVRGTSSASTSGIS